jgi:hypothetical protein
MQAKRIKRNVEREVTELMLKRLTWKIFAEGISGLFFSPFPNFMFPHIQLILLFHPGRKIFKLSRRLSELSAVHSSRKRVHR